MVISDRKDRVAAAEAAGHLGHIKQFSFILMLEIFADIMSTTKPLSDALQAKELNLPAAINLVDAIIKTLEERRIGTYFMAKIWNPAEDKASVRRVRHTHIPLMINDSIVMESVGGRFETMHMAREDFYKMKYWTRF